MNDQATDLDFGLAILEHFHTKSRVYSVLKRTHDPECPYRTADDNSDIANEWNVIEFVSLVNLMALRVCGNCKYWDPLDYSCCHPEEHIREQQENPDWDHFDPKLFSCKEWRKSE